MTDKALTTVLHDLSRVLQHIAPDQKELPTPCTAMTVGELRVHLLDWLRYFDESLAGAAPPATPEAGDEIDRLMATLATAVAAGVETATVEVARLGGAYPGSVVLDMLASEALGHGWDLARATGQRWQPDPAICERALTALRGIVQPAYRGDGLPFGPEVPVDAQAPALDRFLAFTGRDPHWAPGGLAG